MITATIIVTSLLAFADGAANCPMHAKHSAAAAVDHRHDSFGFSHEASKHTFRLLKDGGAIELRATDNRPETIALIRTHMKDIAASFQKNDFTKPQFVHERMPDGVGTMRERAKSIQYKFDELPEGARVVITTNDAKALAAVHEFLRFQIADHRTGDPTEVK
jgi:hypothetical protein